MEQDICEVFLKIYGKNQWAHNKQAGNEVREVKNTEYFLSFNCVWMKDIRMEEEEENCFKLFFCLHH